MAPLLDCCSKVKIYEIKDGRIGEIGVLDMRNKSFSERLKTLWEVHPDVLVCNGISFFYRACMLIQAIHVISNVIGEEEMVLAEIMGKTNENIDSKRI